MNSKQNLAQHAIGDLPYPVNHPSFGHGVNLLGDRFCVPLQACAEAIMVRLNQDPVGQAAHPAAEWDHEGQPRCRYRLLARHGIVTTGCLPYRAPREMPQPLLRISPHVDCTTEDLVRLRWALRAVS